MTADLISRLFGARSTESKREKDGKSREENTSPADGSHGSSGTASTPSVTSSSSSTVGDAGRCPSASVTSAQNEPPAAETLGRKPAERPVSLHVPSLSTAWNKRTGHGLVGAARARGWLRSYHPNSSSNGGVSVTANTYSSDSVDIGGSSSAPASPAADSGCSLPSPGPLFSTNNSTSSASSNSSAACITPAFAATLNAALASGPLTPTTPTNPSANPFPPSSSSNHLYHVDSSTASASTGPTPAANPAANLPVSSSSGMTSRPTSLPPGMAPGHGLLSALLVGGAGNSSSVTPPTLRQTTQVILTSSSASCTSSSTSSASSSSATTTAPSFAYNNSTLHASRNCEAQSKHFPRTLHSAVNTAVGSGSVI